MITSKNCGKNAAVARATDEMLIAKLADEQSLKASAPELVPPGYVLYEDEAERTRRCGRNMKMRPASSATRAIIPFHPEHWWSVGHGMNDKDLFLPPSALQALGLRVETWATHMKALQQVQKLNRSKVKTVALYCFTLGVAAFLNLGSKYQRALSKWQDEFNKSLGEIGMHCKTQTHVHGFMFYNGKNVQYAECCASWLAIAVGPEAVAALTEEAHFTTSGLANANRKNSRGRVV